MRRSTFVLMALCTLAQSTAAWSQVVDLKTQPASPPPAVVPAKAMTTCEALALDWRNVEVDLAKNDAEGTLDNSAPRATMRAIQDNNALLLASMTLELMHDHKCPLPKRAPSKVTYMLPALECRTEQMKGNYKAAQCDTSNWKRIGQ